MIIKVQYMHYYVYMCRVSQVNEITSFIKIVTTCLYVKCPSDTILWQSYHYHNTYEEVPQKMGEYTPWFNKLWCHKRNKT